MARTKEETGSKDPVSKEKSFPKQLQVRTRVDEKEEFKQWVLNQRNLSESIRYLIELQIMRHGVEDIGSASVRTDMTQIDLMLKGMQFVAPVNTGVVSNSQQVQNNEMAASIEEKIEEKPKPVEKQKKKIVNRQETNL